MPPLIRRVTRRLTAHVDGLLLGAVLLLMAAGVIVLYSASNASLPRVSSQLVNMLVALGVMWVFANIPPHYLMRLSLPVYVLGLLLLIGVALFGEVVNGARRWLNIGVTRIQPAELMKIAVPLMLAWYFNRYEATLKLRNHIIAAALLVLPVGLIARQPDLGTAVLIFAGGCYVLFLAGLSWRIIAGVTVAGLASLPLLWPVMHDYQRQRILTLLDPAQDPLGAGYHTIQSTIAVGSGGLLGKGWMNGTQTHLDFIPERTTDFIFAVYSEEFGLLGTVVLLFLFLLVIARGIVITANAPTLFTRLLAGAIALTFFTYAFVNMGMVSGILPVVGVPLPLISYGGTSLVTICLGFGILMSIQTHKKLVQT
ncbi:MAG: rod shape-determining protein RodA [Betaproteobacteria bacterium RIFCSPLOWO2_12_FULL_62_58]|nr:MAG: rod shape-determining protein RodA [Betaproteobacteria bacterium RIFCSPLOWO2_02_64_14]OGA46989.1 MAG: rod shape-determining protein RodA [Betaproteobacteria bacterium RIFCSPLOWO2_12_FULL_62_58]